MVFQNVPADLSQCVFVIEQALSVRALQEIISSNDAEAVSHTLSLVTCSSVTHVLLSQTITHVLQPHMSISHTCSSVTVMGKHPDLMVAHPTPTIFRPLVEIFEISYFFAKNIEKVYTKTSTRRPTFGRNLPKVVNFGEKKTSRPWTF